MDTPLPKLELSLKSIFRPLLVADGFKGSGRNYRRVLGGWIHAINVQGNRHGGSFCINFGIHPESVPAEFQSDPKKIREIDCEFRGRLSETGVDQWWEYQDFQSSMDVAVEQAADIYGQIGGPYSGNLPNQTVP